MLKDKVLSVKIVKFQNNKKEELKDIIVREHTLTVFLNNKKLVTLLCSPVELNELVVGFLYSQGIINSQEDIEKLFFENEERIVKVKIKEKDSCENLNPLNIGEVNSQVKITAEKIFELYKNFQNKSEIFKLTGGVHSAAISDNYNIILFSEDIGRQNAIDKILGKAVLKKISISDKMVFTSGRISSEIILKMAKVKIPVLVSCAAPTDVAVELAKKFKITLIGFLRGKRMNIYSEEKRII